MASRHSHVHAPRPRYRRTQQAASVERALEAALQFKRAGRHNEAARLCRQVLAADRNNARASYLLGLIESDLGEVESAIRRISKFIRLSPKNPDAHSNLCVTLTRQGKQMAKAIAAGRKAVSLRPDNPVFHFNLGNTFRVFGRVDDAMASYCRAIALRPDYVQPRNNLGMLQLMSGQFEAGWRNYLIRPFMLENADQYWRKPLPPDLSGKRILVDQEQGLGDEIFFLRFMPALQDRGGDVSYLPAPRLAAMLERSGIVPIVDAGAAHAAYDYRLSAGDLPYALGMKDDDPVPPTVTLLPLEERVEAFRRRLSDFGPPPYIGVTWRAGHDAGPNADMKRMKEAPHPLLAKTVGAADARVVALQRNPRDGEVAAFEAALGRPVIDLTACNDDLEDMLALMGSLDYYVGLNNTNQHLRAARGGTSHIFVANPPDFRWMSSGDESPWYPGTRVYRQDRNGDWADALAALTDGLKRLRQG